MRIGGAADLNLVVESSGTLTFDGRAVRCALGLAGVIAAEHKREGDGATPAGAWPLRRLLYRPDREPPPATKLPLRPIAANDGWCDAPDDPLYNQPVRLPYPASAERLWREDGLYDLLAVLGHNEPPARPSAGSAIFLHLSRPDFAPTEGCVAIARADMLAILKRLAPGDLLTILAPGAANETGPSDLKTLRASIGFDGVDLARDGSPPRDAEP